MSWVSGSCSDQFIQLPPEQLWISTDKEIPFLQFAPVIDCGDPSSGSSVFGVNLIRLKAFNLRNEVDTVCESDDKIGFVEMGYAVVFVRDSETEMIVSHITFYNLRLLQPKFGGTFPSAGIQFVKACKNNASFMSELVFSVLVLCVHGFRPCEMLRITAKCIVFAACVNPEDFFYGVCFRLAQVPTCFRLLLLGAAGGGCL